MSYDFVNCPTGRELIWPSYVHDLSSWAKGLQIKDGGRVKGRIPGLGEIGVCPDRKIFVLQRDERGEPYGPREAEVAQEVDRLNSTYGVTSVIGRLEEVGL